MVESCIQTPCAIRIWRTHPQSIDSISQIESKLIHFLSQIKIMPKQKQWDKKDSAALVILFQKGAVSRGGRSPTDLSKENIEAVRAKHFPEVKYSNFRRHYRRLASQFETNEKLTGARKKSSKCKICFLFYCCTIISQILIILSNRRGSSWKNKWWNYIPSFWRRGFFGRQYFLPDPE